MNDNHKNYLTAKVAIDSFRDNGYSNTAYALAELVDNSIQAKANRVEVGFIEENNCKEKYSRDTVSQISVWDNGIGMDSKTLELALEFGGSQNREDKKGMGKFGMGLPNSSISQCKKLEVWSWQNGKTPIYTYLDIDEMKKGELEFIPTPIEKEIPKYIDDSHFTKREDNGTLILWTKLDRLNWKTGKSIFRHCEFLVGRIYRNFLGAIDNSKVIIDSVIYKRNDEDSIKEVERFHFKPNDPLYLLKDTSLPILPGDYKNEAFFELSDDEEIEVEYYDEDEEKLKKSKIRVRSSIVKKEIAKEILSSSTKRLGSTEWGTHCSRNIGVSVVRAGRELTIKRSLVRKDLVQYKGRFIGQEIHFDPELDKVFGVTNNKQDALNLIDYDFNEIAIEAGFESETDADFENDLKNNNDPLLIIRQVLKALKNQEDDLNIALKSISVEPGGSHETESPEENASEIIPSGTDEEYEDIDAGELEVHFEEEGDSPEEAKEKVEKIKLRKYRYWIEKRSRDSAAFFDVASKQGITLVTFNTNHQYYEQFISKLSDSQLTLMEVAIAGFAQVMRNTTDRKRKAYLETVRRSWGEILEEWLTISDEDDF